MADPTFTPGAQGTPAQGNPRKAAIALGYVPGNVQAPRVVAAGKGLMAERILAVAREHGIPEREDAMLAAALGKIEVGREIPPVLYRAVAEVLAFVYRLNQRVDAQR